MTMQEVDRIAEKIGCSLVGRCVTKLGRGKGQAGRLPRGILLDDDAALVEEGTRADEQANQVFAKPDLIRNYQGFGGNHAILGVGNVELKSGAQLILLIRGIQV